MIYLSNDGESDNCYGKQFQGDRFGPSGAKPNVRRFFAGKHWSMPSSVLQYRPGRSQN